MKRNKSGLWIHGRELQLAASLPVPVLPFTPEHSEAFWLNGRSSQPFIARLLCSRLHDTFSDMVVTATGTIYVYEGTDKYGFKAITEKGVKLCTSDPYGAKGKPRDMKRVIKSFNTQKGWLLYDVASILTLSRIDIFYFPSATARMLVRMEEIGHTGLIKREDMSNYDVDKQIYEASEELVEL